MVKFTCWDRNSFIRKQLPGAAPVIPLWRSAVFFLLFSSTTFFFSTTCCCCALFEPAVVVEVVVEIESLILLINPKPLESDVGCCCWRCCCCAGCCWGSFVFDPKMLNPEDGGFGSGWKRHEKNHFWLDFLIRISRLVR